MAVPKGRKNITRTSTKYNVFNNQSSPYKESRTCFPRTRVVLLVVILSLACFLAALPTSPEEVDNNNNNSLVGVEQVDRIVNVPEGDESTKAISTETLAEHTASPPSQQDTGYVEFTPDATQDTERISIPSEELSNVELPPPQQETRFSVRQVPAFDAPRITFPESLDHALDHACTSNNEIQTTLIMTMFEDPTLLERLQELCTHVWKTDPLIVVVRVPPTTLDFGKDLESNALFSCKHMHVLVHYESVATSGEQYTKADGEQYDDYSVARNNAVGHPDKSNDDAEVKTGGYDDTYNEPDVGTENTTSTQSLSPGIHTIDQDAEPIGAPEPLEEPNHVRRLRQPRQRRRQQEQPQQSPTLSEFPSFLAYLHNVALAMVYTSHVLILDESAWPMQDLDVSIRSAYHTTVPIAAALSIAQVETQKTMLTRSELPQCLQEAACHFQTRESRVWDGTPKPMPCVHSLHFEPYLVIPWCLHDLPENDSDNEQNPGRSLRQRRQQILSEPENVPQLAWHDEQLSPRAWRLAQADHLRYMGTTFWLAPGFVSTTRSSTTSSQASSVEEEDDPTWTAFHQRVIERFGDTNVQLPVCPVGE